MEGAAAENMPDEASDVEMEEPEELTAEKSINPIFSTAGGTLINQGTLMTKLSLTPQIPLSKIQFCIT